MIDNIWLAVGLTVLLLAAAAILFVFCFLRLPRGEQLAKVREWLLWAVVEAEKELGGGTGKLKLRQVYDLFVTRFPWLAKAVSFELFGDLVDDALDEMREMLKSNKAVQALVSGEETQNETTGGVIQ